MRTEYQFGVEIEWDIFISEIRKVIILKVFEFLRQKCQKMNMAHFVRIDVKWDFLVNDQTILLSHSFYRNSLWRLIIPVIIIMLKQWSNYFFSKWDFLSNFPTLSDLSICRAKLEAVLQSPQHDSSRGTTLAYV